MSTSGAPCDKNSPLWRKLKFFDFFNFFDFMKYFLNEWDFQKKNLPFLRIELWGATEVYDWHGFDFLLNLESVEDKVHIFHLNFRIFEFFHRALTFWESLHKSFIELPECQFGPTCEITTASYNNWILDLNTALESILSVLLSRNKILLPSFISIAVICPQVPPKCCFHLKISIPSNSTFTAKIRMKNVFPKADTIFFWRPRTF